MRAMPFPRGQGDISYCQVEYSPFGSNLERLKARFFALGAGRNLWKPYLSPPDCRKQAPAWRVLGWVGET